MSYHRTDTLSPEKRVVFDLCLIPPLPQVRKPKWYRGKNIVTDGPFPPSVQPPEEEEFFPTKPVPLQAVSPIRQSMSYHRTDTLSPEKNHE
jgi:hypothetical protein